MITLEECCKSFGSNVILKYLSDIWGALRSEVLLPSPLFSLLSPFSLSSLPLSPSPLSLLSLISLSPSLSSLPSLSLASHTSPGVHRNRNRSRHTRPRINHKRDQDPLHRPRYAQRGPFRSRFFSLSSHLRFSQTTRRWFG
jgi:hypothetical protein